MPDYRAANGAQWGNWRYDKSNLTLEYRDPKYPNRTPYAVDLERSNNAVEILDWILQISDKGWATPEDIGNLVRAYKAVVGQSLQGLVSGGETIDMKAILLAEQR